MGFVAASFTGKGGRTKNEDSIFIHQDRDIYLAIVADGLGMHGGGEIASATVVDTIAQCFFNNPLIESNNISSLFETANRAVLDKQTALCKMKSTGVVLFSKHKQIAFAHVGDSRLYHFVGGKLIHQTQDHSVTQMAVITGAIEASQIRFHEDRNRLLRAIGGNETIHPDIVIRRTPVKNMDAFLLCSDGFWEYVLESEMEIDLAKSNTPNTWLSNMLERIGKRIKSGNDNLSAITVFYQ